MEMASAELSSKEGAAIARSESLEQELRHQDSKVLCSSERGGVHTIGYRAKNEDTFLSAGRVPYVYYWSLTRQRPSVQANLSCGMLVGVWVCPCLNMYVNNGVLLSSSVDGDSYLD